MIVLPDVNVLVAIAWVTHRDHRVARDWFARTADAGWATCPQTEMGFVRLCMNAAVVPRPTTAAEAIAMLELLRGVGGHEFWADATEAGHLAKIANAIQGYRQVPDVHLVTLALRHQGAVATLDRGMGQLAASPDAVVLIQSS